MPSCETSSPTSLREPPPEVKILYHHRTASKDGQAVHIEEMISALREQGHEVHVVSPAVGSGSGMGDKVGWVHRLRATLPKALYELMELAYSWVAYRRLLRAARAFRPDALYERANLFLLAGVMAKRTLGIPMLLEVNAPLSEERGRFGGLALPWLARWSERAVWRGADCVLPVTRVLGDMVVAAGVPPARVTVIPNGINEQHFAAALPPEEARHRLGWGPGIVLGFTGFVRDWHGVDRALRWMASSDAPRDAKLLLVGDGPVREELERLGRELGLGDRFRVTGFVDRHEVPALVASFDIALQPAVTAYASPLKLFEYLAMGKAIAAPAVRNIQEVLTHDVNALLFDPTDESAFARVLTRLAHDHMLRQRLGDAARRSIAEQGLTWAANARRVVALAASLQGRAGRGAPP